MTGLSGLTTLSERLLRSAREDQPSPLQAMPGKAQLSERGWLFLVNDANDFMNVQFAASPAWDIARRSTAAALFSARAAALRDLGSFYRFFAVPEKSVIYDSYLPSTYLGRRRSCRPAQMLQADVPRIASYPEHFLKDARSYGQLYFRGDTHTTWLGAWFVYRVIAEALLADGLLDGTSLISMGDLTPSVAAFEGDLAVQLDAQTRSAFHGACGFTLPSHGLELILQLELGQARRKAYPSVVPEDYASWFTGRETLVYERADNTGPAAVVFRDSTLDFCHDLIAQHFRRTVFIWHQGQVYKEIIEREKPDIVLHIMAERFVTALAGGPVMASITVP